MLDLYGLAVHLSSEINLFLFKNNKTRNDQNTEYLNAKISNFRFDINETGNEIQ